MPDGPENPVVRAVRAGASPVRRYFNAGFELTKDEMRRLAADERAAASADTEAVLAAVGRLEEAIGFLGLQVTEVRAELDSLRAELAARDVAGQPPASRT